MNFSDVSLHSPEIGVCQPKVYGDIQSHHNMSSTLHILSTKLVCDGGKFKHIMNSSEKVFCGGNTQFSWKACKWIEHQSEHIGRHIYHPLCSHGGKRAIKIDKREILVDGYDLETSTIYQL